MHALHPQQRLQRVEQDILPTWDHLALNRRARGLAINSNTPSSWSKCKNSSTTASSSSRYTPPPRTSGTGVGLFASHRDARPPPKPFRAVLRDCFACLCHALPPSSASPPL